MLAVFLTDSRKPNPRCQHTAAELPPFNGTQLIIYVLDIPFAAFHLIRRRSLAVRFGPCDGESSINRFNNRAGALSAQSRFSLCDILPLTCTHCIFIKSSQPF